MRRPVKTVFVDRDGVINVNRPDHVKSWAEFEFLPRALPALASLTRHGFAVYVVTNQAVVNRGLVSQAELDDLHSRMVRAIAAAGGRVSAVLACPHRPDEGCACRKPAPGMLHEAADRYGVDLDTALLIGDHFNDLEAAARAGCRSILVLSGRVTACAETDLPAGCEAVLPDLAAAAVYLSQGSFVSEGDGGGVTAVSGVPAFRLAPVEAGS